MITKIRYLASFILVAGLLLCGTPAPAGHAQAAVARTVAILTPYMTAPATHEMVGLLQKGAMPYGWKTTLVTSEGDIATLASKMEDVIARKVSAILIVHTDLSLLKKQIADAGKVGIPVFGVGTLEIPGAAASVSSNSDDMSQMVTRYLFKRMGYKGNLVVLTYMPQPEVGERTKELYRLLKRYPAIHVVTQQQIDVSSMVQSGNQITTNLLTAHPQPGAITGVWCGWDEPAIGAAQAIMAAHRAGIYVTGIDGSAQAVSLIRQGSPLVATVKQRFDLQASAILARVARVFAGKPVTAPQIYTAAALITRASLMGKGS